MPPSIHRIGVILAAGRGRRMGRTKQLLPWPTVDGEKPLIAAAYDAIRPICEAMVVVLGHDAKSVATALEDRPFRRAESDPDAPMFESIRAGLRAAREIDPAAWVALQPGDHPEVAATTLQALVTRATRTPGQVIIPEFGGHGGHPVLIPASIVEILVDADCPGGLGQFWSEHPELCLRLPVNDAKTVCDVDRPGDLPTRLL